MSFNKTLSLGQSYIPYRSENVEPETSLTASSGKFRDLSTTTIMTTQKPSISSSTKLRRPMILRGPTPGFFSKAPAAPSLSEALSQKRGISSEQTEPKRSSFSSIGSSSIFDLQNDLQGVPSLNLSPSLKPKSTSIPENLQDLQRSTGIKIACTEHSDAKINEVRAEYEALKKALTEMEETMGIDVEFDDSEQSLKLYHSSEEVEAISNTLERYYKLAIECKYVKSSASMLDCSFSRQSTFMPVTGRNGEELKQFQEKAQEYLREKSINSKQIKIDAEEEFTTSNIMEKLLLAHEGVCIGEAHCDYASKKFIIDNIDTMVKAGVKTFYLEFLCYDTPEREGFSSLNTPLPAYCEEHLRMLDLGHMRLTRNKHINYSELVKRLRENGIRVVPLDTSLSSQCGVDRSRGVMDCASRQMGMNFVASRIIEEEQKACPGKFVALMGNTHLSSKATFLNEERKRREASIGVSELLGYPSLNVQSADIEAVELNKTDFDRAIPFLTANVKIKDQSQH